MNFHKIREAILQGRNIMTLPLRVTFYARVSTETEDQLNSLENQISYFKDYIVKNPSWTYVDGYIDEGISGSSVKKRKNFLKMIEDSKNDNFDLIITKEVSRFSRNLSDSIKYTQELMSNNVGVYFQSNGINTFDPNSEFILNMMGSVAQEEVKRLSSRVKWGHHEAIKKGRVLGSNRITGYRKEHASLIVVEEEALIVKKIFELYATGKYGFNKLAIELHKQGINNSKGNIYDKDTLKRIISNPKYKGFYSGHTTEVIDYKTKKRITIPKEERIIYRSKKIPSIVSEDLWEKANNILNERSSIIKTKGLSSRRCEKKYPYSGKIFCAEHNTNFQRISNNKRSGKAKWACRYYIRYGLEKCQSPIILENDLDQMLTLIMNKIFNNKDKLLDELLSLYSSIKINNIYQTQIKKIRDIITDVKTKKEKILELNITGNLTNLEFQERNELYNLKIKELNKKISALDSNQHLITNNLNSINQALIHQLRFTENIQSYIEIFLDEIIVSKKNNDRNNLQLDIFLNLIPSSNKITKTSKKINNISKNKLLYSSDFFPEKLSKSNKKQNNYLYNIYINN